MRKMLTSKGLAQAEHLELFGSVCKQFMRSGLSGKEQAVQQEALLLLVRMLQRIPPMPSADYSFLSLRKPDKTEKNSFGTSFLRDDLPDVNGVYSLRCNLVGAVSCLRTSSDKQ